MFSDVSSSATIYVSYVRIESNPDCRMVWLVPFGNHEDFFSEKCLLTSAVQSLYTYRGNSYNQPLKSWFLVMWFSLLYSDFRLLAISYSMLDQSYNVMMMVIMRTTVRFCLIECIDTGMTPSNILIVCTYQRYLQLLWLSMLFRQQWSTAGAQATSCIPWWGSRNGSRTACCRAVTEPRA